MLNAAIDRSVFSYMIIPINLKARNRQKHPQGKPVMEHTMQQVAIEHFYNALARAPQRI
jgi:hypothetical protein